MMMMISRQQAADQSVSCYDDHDHDDHDNDDDQKAVRRQQTDQSAAVESSANGPASFFSHMPTFSKVHIKLCFIYYVIFISIFIFIFLSSAMWYHRKLFKDVYESLKENGPAHFFYHMATFYITIFHIANFSKGYIKWATGLCYNIFSHIAMWRYCQLFKDMWKLTSKWAGSFFLPSCKLLNGLYYHVASFICNAKLSFESNCGFCLHTYMHVFMCHIVTSDLFALYEDPQHIKSGFF